MSLQSLSSDIDFIELKTFLDWILSIGDGIIGSPKDGHVGNNDAIRSTILLIFLRTI